MHLSGSVVSLYNLRTDHCLPPILFFVFASHLGMAKGSVLFLAAAMVSATAAVAQMSDQEMGQALDS
jgi:hypothetical protein